MSVNSPLFWGIIIKVYLIIYGSKCWGYIVLQLLLNAAEVVRFFLVAITIIIMARVRALLTCNTGMITHIIISIIIHRI